MAARCVQRLRGFPSGVTGAAAPVEDSHRKITPGMTMCVGTLPEIRPGARRSEVRFQYLMEYAIQ